MSRRRVLLKSAAEVDLLRHANRHSAEILQRMCSAVAPGISTWDLDQIAREEIAQRPVSSAFLGYNGFPATVCVSVNEEIVHGIPRRSKVLQEGDIVTIDFGVAYEGYVGDTARTLGVGSVSAAAQQLMDVTRASLDRALGLCTTAYRLSDLGRAVQDHAESFGYGVVRDFVGHGVGRAMHEEPQVPNYYTGPKPRLKAGLVLAIEPMVCAGTHQVEILDDGWTAVTRDRRLSAHFEDSVAILPGGPEVLSRL